MFVNGIKEFAVALTKKESKIVMRRYSKEGKLSEVITITGPVVWGFCGVCLAGCITSAIIAVATAPASPIIAPPAFLVGSAGFTAASVALGGVPITLSAVSLGVAGGGIGVLNTLRKYNIEKSDDEIILTLKK
jgi:hypothetical protein